jgi:predicted nucleic acid-binding protein
MRAIADTGLLVAFARADDQYHDWAVEIARQITWPVLTCEAVLAETAFHLRSSEQVLGMLRDDLIRLAFDCTSHLEHLHDLATRYADRKPDLADLCLIRMSELYPRHTLITVDRDFRVYRRNKRETIPTILPPKLLI